MSFLLWVLGSLIAISLIGDHPYSALALTLLAGAAFGLNTYLDYYAAPQETASGTAAIGGIRGVIARWGWLVDVGAMLLLIFPTRWMAAGFSLVLVSWMLRGWAHQRILRRTVFDRPILALLLMVLVSLWASADLAVSLIPLAQIVAGVNLFYALAARVQTETDLGYVAIGLVILGVVIALVAPFGVDWIKTKFFALPQIYRRFRQVLSNGIHPNLLAGALALVFPLGVSLWLYAPLRFLNLPERLARALLVGGLVLMAAILILSQSRGGITATIIGLLLLLAVKGRRVVGSALALLTAVMAIVLTRLDSVRLVDIFFSTDTVSGLAGREEVWSRAVYALQDVPYTGIGLGMFSRAVKVLYPLFLAGPDADIGYAHNIFLQVGVDLGIPGLVAYVALVILGLVLAWRAFFSARRRGDGDRAAIALGLAVSLIVIMLHGLVDSAVWDTKPAILSWLLLGMIATADRLECAAEARDRSALERDSRTGDRDNEGMHSSATEGERTWFETEARRRHAIDRILYDAPAFDTVVQAGFAFLQPSPGERVLDLGCGEGKETCQFARLGTRVIALDMSYVQLMRARARLNGNSEDRSVAFVQANAEQLPFAPGSFHKVYGKAILHHLNVPKAAWEVCRILRLDGRASFAEPLAYHPLFRLARRCTPQLRTRNESPLTWSSLVWLGNLFERHELDFRFLVAPVAYVLRLSPWGEPWFRRSHASLQRLDAWLLQAIPSLRRWSWYGLINIQRRDP